MAEKEYIEREAALNAIKDEIENYQPNPDRYSITPYEFVRRGLNIAYSIIKNQSTANVQEIVRCKDCKKFCPYLSFCDDNCIGAFGNCQITHMNVSPDFYCGHGEKKDKE